MAAKVDLRKAGTWHWQPIQTSFVREHKIKIIVVFALASLLAGGLLYHFKINAIASYGSFGLGGSIVVATVLYKLIKKRNDNYYIVSWNVGVKNDYHKMCIIRDEMSKPGATYAKAYQINRSDAVVDYSHRSKLFEKAFASFNNPDIICLQETEQMKSQDLQAMLPAGYAFFTFSKTDGVREEHNCTVAWNAKRFEKLGHAMLNYDPNWNTSLVTAPDTIVLLRDKTNGCTLCVGSAHLRGFNLNEKEDSRGKRAGDSQARYDLDTMALVRADAYVFAGDFNATPEHYDQRFALIREAGFTQATTSYPTIFDPNLKEGDGVTPKAVCLDYICAKGGLGKSVAISPEHILNGDLSNFDRPSDHLPVGAFIRVPKT